MKNPFASAMKAARLMQKGRPMSSAFAMHGLLTAPAKPLKKAPARKSATKRIAKPTPPARPLPGSFTDGLFESKYGAIRYKLYTPTGSARRRMPIVVMLHGCSQSAGDFATGTGMNQLADERGVIMLCPEQSRSANMARCWNWHRPGDQLRGKGEPALIAGLTRHAIALARADPTRVYIAGISAGGVAAAIIGQAYPELFVAVGIHSALTRGDVSTVSGALAAMRGRSTSEAPTGRTPRPRPTIVFHGDADTVVHPSNADGFLSLLERSTHGPLVSQREQGTSEGGRAFTRTEHRDAKGDVMLENWTIHGSNHAWSGGARAGSYTDPAGPDASREMLRFFLARRRKPARKAAP
ncbi:PHB depolymerase family esterase [Sphingobium sp. SA2]|uniref:extracellular catalytic domain type 1 short-chain-length polyhydroxyalkanoate depolymerase n=1 Tax=Sphingobium sp. SA2 TaxID=1524832 RepID=UPI0028C14567|nr:PHB depolymerase family esterase [Sphingobium sp. SA2]MDT7535241.1 PHB depolymerase family esterase [Sphingobium sp. SA2]